MKFILDLFRNTIHSAPSPLGFFEHKTKDSKLKISKTYLSDTSINSSNVNINHQPRISRCVGGCDQKFPGCKRYIFWRKFTNFARHNVDLILIKLNESLRFKFKKGYQPSIKVVFTPNHGLEFLCSEIEPNNKGNAYCPHDGETNWEEPIQ